MKVGVKRMIERGKEQINTLLPMKSVETQCQKLISFSAIYIYAIFMKGSNKRYASFCLVRVNAIIFERHSSAEK
jgi:hypothetical protein